MSAPTQLPPFLATALHGTPGLASPHAHSTTPILDLEQEKRDALAIGPSSMPVTGKQDFEVAQDAYLEALLQSSAVQNNVADSLDGLTATPALLVPPLNFDMICGARVTELGPVYRSGFPNERNYPFLNTLNLRTVVYLAADDVRPNLQRWIDSSQGRVQLLHFRLNVNKEPFGEMDQEIVAAVLKAMLDKRNLPMLIHCNKGKYRVGVITALLRRLQGWSLTSIYDEYVRFAGTDRVADEEFIDMFPLSMVRSPETFGGEQWL